MAEVGAYEAKTHLPRLLKRVAKGERITITRHGVPVAELVPVGQRTMTAAEAVTRLREFRKGVELGGVSIRELIEDGRR